MSRYFSDKYLNLKPYVPGEQPRDMKYIKLNTNESPFPPSAGVISAVAAEAMRLQIYSDPECAKLIEKIAEAYSVNADQVIVSNGSDEVLNFAFMAFADEEHPLVFPDISYGFYPVFAELNHIPYEELPLDEDFSINVDDYKLKASRKTIVIANPNAHTGLALSTAQLEDIIRSNPYGIVIVDEAYVDFGAESVVKLIDKYDNLLVVQTFSKSRSMAGARLGMAFGNSELIKDLNTIKYSVNPYNVNRMTCVAGEAAISDNEYYMKNCGTIIDNRRYTIGELERLGFETLPSSANFILTRSDEIDGETLYTELKERGILVRHFNTERIKDYNRISVGTKAQMDVLLEAIIAIINK